MTTSLLDIPVKRADGQPASLGDYRGKVMLVVNVASKCGLTQQYAGLEKLYEEKREQGLVVLGFPANDFAGQEPGTEDEIVAFCTSTFDVQFPIFSKISVVGPQKHPLYQTLTASGTATTGDGPMREKLKGYGVDPAPGEVVWNFEKFLIGRDGTVAARFAPDVTADDPRLVSVLDQELARAG